MEYISRFLLWVFNWKVIGKLPDINKYIIISAPHTSNIDFIVGALYLLSVNQKAKFLIKKELFVFPLSLILKILGGIPVNRKKTGNMVTFLVNEFLKKENFILIITPEGTRKKQTRWRSGFYYISKQANVPVVLSSIDYKSKILKISDPYIITNDMETEIKTMKKYFKQIHPKYPEKFSIGEE
ncbi:MAG: 1-acyl-sn-glycerol-3-phosphate acyltransferase [Bacteroidales bacterium]|nr:1-acyl-sn-glycerol-3-phosphate acyltransferase [Bacteroidales bacterium]